jgi:hypothetical protein
MSSNRRSVDLRQKSTSATSKRLDDFFSSKSSSYSSNHTGHPFSSPHHDNVPGELVERQTLPLEEFPMREILIPSPLLSPFHQSSRPHRCTLRRSRVTENAAKRPSHNSAPGVSLPAEPVTFIPPAKDNHLESELTGDGHADTMLGQLSSSFLDLVPATQEEDQRTLTPNEETVLGLQTLISPLANTQPAVFSTPLEKAILSLFDLCQTPGVPRYFFDAIINILRDTKREGGDLSSEFLCSLSARRLRLIISQKSGITQPLRTFIPMESSHPQDMSRSQLPRPQSSVVTMDAKEAVLDILTDKKLFSNLDNLGTGSMMWSR